VCPYFTKKRSNTLISLRIHAAISPVDIQKWPQAGAFNNMNEYDPDSIVHAEYISHLTYTASLAITKPLTVFDVYNNEADALASFTGHVLSIVEAESMTM
jgi:hypothetical protein